MGIENMIKLQGLSKIYHTPAGDFAALRSIDLQISAGEFVAIVGKSGAESQHSSTWWVELTLQQAAR